MSTQLSKNALLTNNNFIVAGLLLQVLKFQQKHDETGLTVRRGRAKLANIIELNRL
ncbi:hypothetical protein GARC_4112 [Paraglaciecola arctica BSs20135]|uniref:Uncharacterized protein n=1 Tax=Paraglaciecola arctica BSs20135 TaxID=493475 RepID=K6XK66_9ALTE|nr:hypothetical protein GARC_4112 [Paraglaciecola arctica BSs20135]